jgi:hypothetical protein
VYRSIKLNNDTSSIFFKNALTTLQQPMIMPRFKTPPKPKSKRRIRFLTGSCVDSLNSSLEFAVWNGDNYYMDNGGDSLSEFYKRYDSLFRNDYLWKSYLNQINYYNMDDHEVEDNWDTKVQFICQNKQTSFYVILDQGVHQLKLIHVQIVRRIFCITPLWLINLIYQI